MPPGADPFSASECRCHALSEHVLANARLGTTENLQIWRDVQTPRLQDRLSVSLEARGRTARGAAMKLGQGYTGCDIEDRAAIGGLFMAVAP